MKKRLIYLLILLTIFGAIAVVFAFQGAANNIYKQITLLGKVAKVIYTDYVDPIDYRKLIKGAIDGMTSTLDPHTVFFTPTQYKELQVDTRGKFGGLGIQIGIRNGWLTIIAPIEGTPAYRAGLQAGDRIIKIEGKSTWGITVEQAVKKLRGEPGTKVTITIQREGEPEPFDVTITRDIIEIKPVPFYGMTEEGVGYIRLSSFSAEAGHAVKNALEDLISQGAKGIILDLRYNPGGLLSQAVAVANQFLPKDALVVYTKGRSFFQNRQYYTDHDGVYKEGKLIVLVDRGSASASEIVAGAIQDHDRGLIMGTNTFGKGLVQSIRPLDGGTALKITTAKYYIPSGRCIQKEDYLLRRNCAIIPDTALYNPDTLDPWSWIYERQPPDTSDTSKAKKEREKPIFYTAKGRIVYGGGGITPDIKFEPPLLTRLEAELERKGLFFDFAVHYVATHKNAIKSPDFEVTDEMIEEFKKFLKEKNFTYKTRSQLVLEQLDSIAVQDSLSEETMKQLEALKVRLEAEKEHEFARSLSYIKRAIKRELVSKLFGLKERYKQITLKSDPAIRKAVEIILNDKEYNKYLEVTEKKK